MIPENVTDIILIVSAVGFAGWGIYRGAIRQIGWIAAFLCSFFMARMFGQRCAEAMDIDVIIAYIAVFIAVFIIVSILFRVLKFTAHLLLMGPLDRAAGMLVALFKWGFCASLLLNIFYLCNPHWPIFSSVLASHTMKFAPKIFGLATGYLS